MNDRPFRPGVERDLYSAFEARDPFGGKSSSNRGPGDEASLAAEAVKNHAKFTAIMQARLGKVRVLRAHWARSNYEAMAEELSAMRDQAVYTKGISIVQILAYRPHPYINTKIIFRCALMCCARSRPGSRASLASMG